MSEVELAPRDIQEDPEFIALGDIDPTVARLGAAGTSESVEVKAFESNPVEEELEELLSKHPQGELVISKFDEVVEIFDRLEAKEKLRSDFDAPEGPTIGLAKRSAGMIRLNELGALDNARFEEERATIAETAFVRLYMDQNAHAVIAGEQESLTIGILKLKEQLFIESQREAMLGVEQEDQRG